MAFSRREERFLKAFESCVEHGEYTADYAVTLLEDDRRYGWMSNDAKDAFYDWLDNWEREQEEKDRAEAEEAPGRAQTLASTPPLDEDEDLFDADDDTPSGEELDDDGTDSVSEESSEDDAGSGEQTNDAESIEPEDQEEEVTEDEPSEEPEND